MVEPPFSLQISLMYSTWGSNPVQGCHVCLRKSSPSLISKSSAAKQPLWVCLILPISQLLWGYMAALLSFPKLMALLSASFTLLPKLGRPHITMPVTKGNLLKLRLIRPEYPCLLQTEISHFCSALHCLGPQVLLAPMSHHSKRLYMNYLLSFLLVTKTQTYALGFGLEEGRMKDGLHSGRYPISQIWPLYLLPCHSS